MSRLFDALQEAARFRTVNNPNPPPGTVPEADSTPPKTVWSELGISLTPDPGIAENGRSAVSSAEASTSVATAREVSEVASPKLDVIDREVSRRIPLTGTPAKLLLDKNARLIPHTADTIVLERYRMLRTRILQERESRPFRSLVVTSSAPQEGKTVTVLNLALSFAALPSFKVLVVDGDVRRGTLGDWLGIDPGRPGLSNLLDGSAQLEQVVLKSEDLSLCVIPRGNAQVADLQPARFGPYFRRLTEEFDLVLVDTPPVNLITDAQIIAGSCDAVLLIARAFSTTSKGLEEAVDKLQPFRLIGTVLNAGEPRRSRKYHGYY